MDLALQPEHAELTSAVADIVRNYGSEYYVRHADERQPRDEVWGALGDAGFIGVNIPEQYGGGGAGLLELALVCEEAAAQGVPLLLMIVPAAISAEVITAYGSESQRASWLPGLAAGGRGTSGARPSARTRGSPTRWPRRRSRPNLPR